MAVDVPAVGEALHVHLHFEQRGLCVREWWVEAPAEVLPLVQEGVGVRALLDALEAANDKEGLGSGN